VYLGDDNMNLREIEQEVECFMGDGRELFLVKHIPDLIAEIKQLREIVYAVMDHMVEREALMEDPRDYWALTEVYFNGDKGEEE
jgi:hypothetical protein